MNIRPRRWKRWTMQQPEKWHKKMPLLSIIITSRNSPQNLVRSLEAVLRNTRVAHEIIVGDDSGAATWDIHAAIPKHIREQILYLPAPSHQQGFAVNANRCLPFIRGLFVTIPIAEDVEVQEGWDTEAIAAFKGGGVGQVAFHITFGNGSRQQNGTELSYVGKGMTTRHIFELLGNYDTRYFPCYGEDVDMSWRVTEAGFKIVDCPTSRIIHHHNHAIKTEIDNQHREKLYAKWKKYPSV